MNRSVSTVKADAAHLSFSALGKDIVWAVMDSGIDKTHPHFSCHQNLDLGPEFDHKDFTDSGADPLKDPLGHGTHVAGIIAGEFTSAGGAKISGIRKYKDETDHVQTHEEEIARISGMAPRSKLLSLKVLDNAGVGVTRNLMRAIDYVQQINGYGRRLKIHGVNMSV